MVELALSLTLLIILLAGIVDIGRAFFSWVALRDAAQEGALYGSVNPTDAVEIEDRVRSASSTPVDLTDVDAVAVDIFVAGLPCTGGAITVTVTYDFPIAMPFITTIVGSQTLAISASVTDTILRPSCVLP